MIDLDELQAAINRCAFDGDVLGLSKAECSDLLARLRQAEKDAERHKEIIGDCRGAFIIAGDNEMISAIDEAMQCK